MLTCPVCQTSNPEGTLACQGCQTPIEIDQATIVLDGSLAQLEAEMATFEFPTPIPPKTPRNQPAAPHSSDPSQQLTQPEGGTAWSVAFRQLTPADALTVLQPGTLLGNRYEILASLGEGGMGAVYKARDRELDRMIALKVIRPELSNNPDLLRRFKQELLLSRQITHRNVIRIFDLGVADGRRFITMQFIEGQNLKALVARHGVFSAEEATAVVRQICAGLAVAHNEGVIHRDLKPQNVLVDGDGRVYVMDFGLARSMEEVGMTRTGALIGTPDYMSPEQTKGEKLDGRSDLFAVGLIYYELLTGVLPYESDSMVATLIKRTKEKPIAPKALRPEIPDRISDIIMKCLEIDRARRYATAEAILQDLDAPAPAVSAPVRPVFQDPTQFGSRYRIDAVLGEGGMGTVYRATDLELSRTVALKLVRSELASDPAAMDRLKQEILLASRISHRNILRIHDLGEVDGVKFISMAYVEGEDLHQLIQRTGRLTEERTIRIARQLCAALEAAHSEGVLHRDLKPRNILIDATDCVFISDFGLAKPIGPDVSSLTHAGEILGTPTYMSPEQAEGKPLDSRTDIYALGLILYEMLTGDLPFSTESALVTMFQRVTQTPRNPKLLNPEISDRMGVIIMRCLATDRENRYAHASDILADLDRGPGDLDSTVPIAPIHAGDSTATPPPAIPAERPISKGRRNRKPWPVLAGIASIVLAAGVIFGPKALNRLRNKQGPSLSAATETVAPKYLAVLPFRAVAGPDELRYEAEGITEAVSTKLFGLNSIRLASPLAAEKVDPKLPIEKIAHELGVNLVLQGTVQGSKQKLVVDVGLDDVQTHKRVWSAEFSGVSEDLLTIEDQIYSKLVDVLALKMTSAEAARAALHPTEDVDAYEFYLKGRSFLRDSRDVPGLKSGLALFEKAAARDPHFALAYTGIADACLRIYELNKDSVWTEKALGAAQQAQRLNDNLPEVHFALGSLYTATGKNNEAVAELKRALELAPNSDDGYRRLGKAYMAIGDQAQGIAAFEKAVAVNGYYWNNYNMLGGGLYQAGKYDRAMDAFRRVTELEPERASGYQNIGVVLYAEGKFQDCIPAFEKALQLRPTYKVYSNLGTAYFYLGRYPQAQAMFEKAVAMNPQQALAVGNLGDVYRQMGQREQANATYDRAIALALKAVRVNPQDTGDLAGLGLYYARKGDPAQGIQFVQRARAIDKNDPDLMYDEAIVDALAGRDDDALAALKSAIAKGYSKAEAQYEPDLKNLRSKPEFTALMR